MHSLPDWIAAAAEVVGALVALGSVIAGGWFLAVRVTLRAVTTAFNARADRTDLKLDDLKAAVEKDQTAITERLEKLEEDRRKDREEMLRDFVRREDWSRVTGSIAIRLDQIWEVITQLRIKVRDD